MNGVVSLTHIMNGVMNLAHVVNVGLDVIHGWRVNLTFIFHCYIANDYSKPNMQYNLHQCFKSF